MTLVRYCILLAAIVSAAAAGAARADQLCFSPADTSIMNFDSFPVHVTVDAIDSIMGYDISVSITGDPCVKILGVIEGPLPGSGGDPTFFRWLDPLDTETISVNGSILGTVVDGPGILFTIYLQALQPGTAHLDFAYSELRDGVNRSIPHGNSCGAVIVIDEAIAVEEATWGAIKSVRPGR